MILDSHGLARMAARIGARVESVDGDRVVLEVDVVDQLRRLFNARGDDPPSEEEIADFLRAMGCSLVAYDPEGEDGIVVLLHDSQGRFWPLVARQQTEER